MKALKYIPLILALLLAACNKYDILPEQAEGFIKFFSNTMLNEQGYDVKETADGGYVAIGTTSDDEGVRDLYLIKTDKYGNEESWSPIIIGGAYDDVGTSIQVVSDGYVILGYSKQTDSTEYDMYLVKTDLQGNVLWEKWTGGTSDEQGRSLQITSAGEYLVAGMRKNPGLGNYDYIVARFDASGNLVNPPRIISSGDPNASVIDVYIIETQTYFVICSTLEFNQKSEIQIIPIFKDSHFQADARKYSASGNLIGNCIQELSDGNLLVCGTIFDPASGLSSIYLNKITASLGTVSGWETYKTFSETAVSLTGNSVRIIDNNSYAILGTHTETGNDDIILLHADAGGTEVSRRIFGDDGFQQGMSLEVTSSDGGLIIVGNNGSEDNSMVALVKTDAAGKL